MNPDKFNTICLVGFRRSGIALCETLLEMKKKVLVTESAEEDRFYLPLISRLRKQKVEFEFGGHTNKFINRAELMILSPGVAPDICTAVEIARGGNMAVVGEVEFSGWLTRARIVAVTGTNGKSTTAFLTYRALKEKHRRVYLAGNIGIPFSPVALRARDNDILVIEVSSYQLETIKEFKPYVACITNLAPDHLDRYKDFSGYVSAKMNIFRNQGPDDYAVISDKIPGLIKPFPVRSSMRYFGREKGNDNFAAVSVIASLFGVPDYTVDGIFKSFNGLPHRMRIIKEVNGVTFINDSKATNPASTVWALRNTNPGIFLIAGGKDKGLDYSRIKTFFPKLKKINLYGQAGEKIRDALSGFKNMELFTDLETAVVSAYGEAGPGDTVLFSPMCSSFDMFSSYIERGYRFMEIVDNIHGQS